MTLENLNAITYPGATSALMHLTEYDGLATVFKAPCSEARHRYSLSESDFKQVDIVNDVPMNYLRANIIRHPLMPISRLLLRYLRSLISYCQYEQVLVLYLDSRYFLINESRLTIRSKTSVPCVPSDIAREAVNCGATSLILAHNHPSGNPRPSLADIQMTRALMKATASVDVQVIDHLIFASRGWMSMRVERMI
jgi:DNA repair protein RadC